jgi:hypothetical protein
MTVTRPSARQFCQGVLDVADGRVGRWVSIADVAEQLGLSLDVATVLADDCGVTGWVRHDRSHLAATMRAQDRPHSVTLSAEGWNLIRKPTPQAGGRS